MITVRTTNPKAASQIASCAFVVYTYARTVRLMVVSTGLITQYTAQAVKKSYLTTGDLSERSKQKNELNTT